MEKEIVYKMQRGDIKAFERLYHKYSTKLYRFAFSLLKNKEDAEGIVQDVFLSVWNKRQEISTEKSFKSYLFTISYNLIIDLLRKRLKEKEYLSHLEKFFHAVTLTPEQEADYSFVKSHIEKAVEELPEKRKKIYKLSRVNGLSHKEIAEQLHISPKTVENQITLALKHLKNRLGTEMLPVLLYLFLFG